MLIYQTTNIIPILRNIHIFHKNMVSLQRLFMFLTNINFVQKKIQMFNNASFLFPCVIHGVINTYSMQICLSLSVCLKTSHQISLTSRNVGLLDLKNIVSHHFVSTWNGIKFDFSRKHIFHRFSTRLVIIFPFN